MLIINDCSHCAGNRGCVRQLQWLRSPVPMYLKDTGISVPVGSNLGRTCSPYCKAALKIYFHTNGGRVIVFVSKPALSSVSPAFLLMLIF